MPTGLAIVEDVDLDTSTQYREAKIQAQNEILI